VLEEFLSPIRSRRAEIAGDPARVPEVLARGTERGRAAAARTLAEVRAAMGLAVYAPRG
jgi:tryptophanyl-tRNA synthetase